MAFCFNGIGTKFYGERDLHADHSYITTEWIVFLHIPILPIRSLRVSSTGSETGGIPVIMPSTTEGYRVFKQSFPNWKQVLSTYGFMLLWVILGYGLGEIVALTDRFTHDKKIAMGVCAVVAAVGAWMLSKLPERLRERAEKKAKLNGW